METKLNLITEIAKMDRKCKFDNLAHLLNVENLKRCFYELKRDKASGVDGLSYENYNDNLESSIETLVTRMKTKSYKPQPVRRVYIPKGNGKTRPLGIPSIEDKIVQLGITKILQAVFEVDFLEFSHGFRPNRSCHGALNCLDKMIMVNPVNYVIDADIKGFFDNVEHSWLMKCIEQRVSDKNLLQLITRFLKGGIMEEGKFIPSEKGTPQGGILSPLLANIYLHYTLDLWIEKVIKRKAQGFIGIVRYADDFIICVQYEDEAKCLRYNLKKRLGKFGLELSEDKTSLIEFGRTAWKEGRETKSFNFLGFKHYCGKSRRGNFILGRKTDKKKFAVKIKEMNIWLKSIRNQSKPSEWWQTLCSKIRGHFQYYGVSGNFQGLKRFYHLTRRLVMKWLNRRSQKKSFNWESFSKYLERHPLPEPKIYHNLYTLYSY